jgi:putative colanic acid biosynthesis acetyltransferase WcaF
MASPILDAAEHDAFAGAPSFRLSHRLFRLAWMLAWTLLAQWTPPPLRRWRILLLRLFGAKVDWRANVYGTARIWYPPNLTMGPHAALGPGVECYCMAPITIGAHAVISQRANLCAGSHDIDSPTFQLFARPIAIGAHAWVAAEAFVGPGVVIGVVLGARAVAMRAIAPWSVAAGNPARHLRERPRPVG